MVFRGIWCVARLTLESGKLVMKMFQHIQDLVADESALVFVLIDEVRLHTVGYSWSEQYPWICIAAFISSESSSITRPITLQVESLTAARTAAMSGSEPSDAIRVVNALLTQIDLIKKYCMSLAPGLTHSRHKNVIILTTSNITGAIDLAFVDR